MSKAMLIDAVHPEEVRVAVVNNGTVEDFDFESTKKKQLRGNIYLAKVTRVEPSLQAAFVDYGGNRHGFLAFSEIHPDYYHLPQEDREALASETTAEVSDEEIDVEEDDESDSEGDELPRRSSAPMRKYKIQEVIKRRQILLVQVVKEERGNKGAALTTYLSLAGRYGVLMPNTPRGGGISRKITNASDRKRIKKIVSELEVPQGMGLIVRTAGAKRTKSEIKRDFEYLTRVWGKIKDLTFSSIAPALIHEEGGLVHRAMRDLYDKDIDTVMVDGENAYREAKDLAKMLMPSHAKKVQHNKSGVPVFVSHRVEDQLNQVFSPEVQLKSGGYLVIHQTEALVAVDVNSGRATKERNIENTALRTNLEAAEEVCRQMRLRDLAGLIVIDFIDMEENKNNRAVERRMKDCLKDDRARVQNGKISMFGLMEISRQRRRAGILESSSDPCGHCNGTGRVRSVPSAALQLLRALEAKAHGLTGGVIEAEAPSDVVIYVLNEKRETLTEIENSSELQVRLVANTSMLVGDFSIQSEGSSRAPVRESVVEVVQVDEDDDVIVEEEDTVTERPRRRRNRRRRKDNAQQSTEGAMEVIDVESAESEEGEASEVSADAETGEDGEPKKRRRRGRRGGRRRRGNGEARENGVIAAEITDEAPVDGGAILDGDASNSELLIDASLVIAAEVVETPEPEQTVEAATETTDAISAAEETITEVVSKTVEVVSETEITSVSSTETTIETAETSDDTEIVANGSDHSDIIINGAPHVETEAESDTAVVEIVETPKKERKRKGWWQRNPLSSE